MRAAEDRRPKAEYGTQDLDSAYPGWRSKSNARSALVCRDKAQTCMSGRGGADAAPDCPSYAEKRVYACCMGAIRCVSTFALSIFSEGKAQGQKGGKRAAAPHLDAIFPFAARPGGEGRLCGGWCVEGPIRGIAPRPGCAARHNAGGRGCRQGRGDYCSEPGAGLALLKGSTRQRRERLSARF